MALFKWLICIEADSLREAIGSAIERAGLVINQAVSSEYALFASDPSEATLHHERRVSLLASWSDRSAREVLIEVRSDEPLLRSGTRCELTAMTLQKYLPPS